MQNKILESRLKNLTKEEVVNLITAYEIYLEEHIKYAIEGDWFPVCVAEFVDCDWDFYENKAADALAQTREQLLFPFTADLSANDLRNLIEDYDDAIQSDSAVVWHTMNIAVFQKGEYRS